MPLDDDVREDATCHVNDVPAATDFIGDARLRYLDRTTVIEKRTSGGGPAGSRILALYTSYTSFPRRDTIGQTNIYNPCRVLSIVHQSLASAYT